MSPREFVQLLQAAAGDNLVGVVAIAADHGPPELLVVLRDTAPEQLAPLGEAVREQRRQLGGVVLLLARREVEAAADVFPLRFAVAQRDGELLAGENPFQDLSIDRDRLRLRAEQELRNLALRVRLRSLLVEQDALARGRLLRDALPTLARCLWALLELDGKAPASARPGDVFARVDHFDLDSEVLLRLAHNAVGTVGPEDVVVLRRVLEQAVEVADRQEGS